jgi:hypothetical protein
MTSPDPSNTDIDDLVDALDDDDSSYEDLDGLPDGDDDTG